jgi:hypothetical protein
MKMIAAICLGMLATVGAQLHAQENAKPQPDAMTLFLPPDVDAGAAFINFFMIGDFGGNGGSVKTETGRASYDIPLAVDGKPADVVKIIAYMPGCEIVKLEIRTQGSPGARTLACKPLGKLALHGKVSSMPVAQTSGLFVETTYLAEWGNQFYGIMDGPVTSIPIAKVNIDESGQFEVELPDLMKQSDLGPGSFQFLLRDKTTGNIIAALKPEVKRSPFGGLEVLSSYEPAVVFTADAWDATP